MMRGHERGRELNLLMRGGEGRGEGDKRTCERTCERGRELNLLKRGGEGVKRTCERGRDLNLLMRG